MRVLFRIMCVLMIAVGAALSFSALLMLLGGGPAYSQMMEGTTAIVMAEGNRELAVSFALGAFGVMAVIPALLLLLSGILGVRALKRGTYGKPIFVAGIYLFEQIFEVIFSSGAAAFDVVLLLYLGIFVAIAFYLSRKEQVAA